MVKFRPLHDIIFLLIAFYRLLSGPFCHQAISRIDDIQNVPVQFRHIATMYGIPLPEQFKRIFESAAGDVQNFLIVSRVFKPGDKSLIRRPEACLSTHHDFICL